MATKIDVARLKAAPSRYISASSYDKSLHGPVICPDVRCGCDLRGVPAGTRNIEKSDGTTEQVGVEAFFGLPANAVKNAKAHTDRCRYNLTATVRKYVALSMKITSFGSNAVPILANTKSGKAEYRLHILVEALNALGRMGLPPDDNHADNKTPLFGTQYVRTKGMLRPYITVARAINSLVARLRGDPVLSDVISLRYDGEGIAWSDYFFDIDDHERLYHYLDSNDQYKRRFGSYTDRPVAFAVRLKKDWEPRPTRYNNLQFACEGRLCTLPSAERAFVNPVIYTRNADVIRFLRTATCVLYCGIPTISAPRSFDESSIEELHKHRFPQARLHMTIHHRSQVCSFSPLST